MPDVADLGVESPKLICGEDPPIDRGWNVGEILLQRPDRSAWHVQMNGAVVAIRKADQVRFDHLASIIKPSVDDVGVPEAGEAIASAKFNKVAFVAP